MGVATGHKIFFSKIEYKMLLTTNPGSQNICWRNESLCSSSSVSSAKVWHFLKTWHSLEMGKMSAIFGRSGRNSLQTCATTLKLSFRERLSLVGKTFLTRLNVPHYSREPCGGRNFCRTPNFSTFTIFQLSCKNIMSETFLGQKLRHEVKSRLDPVTRDSIWKTIKCL